MAIFTITVDQYVNKEPSVIGDNTINVIYENNLHTFTEADFTTNTNPKYEDPEGDSALSLQITNLPSIGEIRLNNVAILLNDEILFTDIIGGLLTYRIDFLQTTAISTSFTFTISDTGSTNYYAGADATFNVNVSQEENLPPSSVGNKDFTISDSNTVVFTSANFTTETTPVYADPEGDTADKLKITSLPTVGIINLDGTPITINQIIPFSEITSGSLTYVPDTGTPYVITFNFEIADSGSGIFTAQ
tara:strand:+ start:1638 stop:2378 length:741 start_codon:yes stop_codon:yes gene_type:complete